MSISLSLNDIKHKKEKSKSVITAWRTFKDGFDLHIISANAPAFKAAFEIYSNTVNGADLDTVKDNQRLIEMVGDEKLFNVVADHLIKDWRGLTNTDDDSNIAFSADNFALVCYAEPDLLSWVLKEASELAKQQIEGGDDVAKKPSNVTKAKTVG